MPKKILFVDDDEDIRFVLNILLKKAGYQVSSLPEINPESHLEGNSYPDLYLLDRHVNGTDLTKFCRMLKEDRRTRHIPVVMISADPKIEAASYFSGADKYVAKPFEPKKLLDILDKLTGQEK
jgi:two-component system phosphate regulon response regulator PhoB